MEAADSTEQSAELVDNGVVAAETSPSASTSTATETMFLLVFDVIEEELKDVKEVVEQIEHRAVGCIISRIMHRILSSVSEGNGTVPWVGGQTW